MTAGRPTYETRLRAKLSEQLRGRNVGFLLGAGASFLNGAGYPLAGGLWPAISDHLKPAERAKVDREFEKGAGNIEIALDRLDNGPSGESLRGSVMGAISKTFQQLRPPLDDHRAFVRRLSLRRERRVPVFTLNYDVLVERAADAEKIMLVDGFHGTMEGYFRPAIFTDVWGRTERRKVRTVMVAYRGVINLLKLHGSLGWFLEPSGIVRRVPNGAPCSEGWRALLIPPQHRKAADTGGTPYAALWSQYRGHLVHGPVLLNRLVCAGYGFGDGHVNAIIESALARRDFTLLILAKELSENAFRQWSAHSNVLIVTESRSSLCGEIGAGMAAEWSFEWLAQEV